MTSAEPIAGPLFWRLGNQGVVVDITKVAAIRPANQRVEAVLDSGTVVTIVKVERPVTDHDVDWILKTMREAYAALVETAG